MDTISDFVLTWGESNDSTCPTCESDVSARGGITSVTSSLKGELQNQISDLRREYQVFQRQLAAIRSELTDLGAQNPPLFTSEQEDLIDGIGQLVGGSDALKALISRGEGRESINGLMAHLKRVPTVPRLRAESGEVAMNIAEEISNVLVEHEKVSRLPEAWKEVQKSIQQRLADVTARHLPKTLQALWLEIAKNIMPAPWQYPGEVAFLIGERRLRPEVAVVLKNDKKSVLATHILNGAEIHNLGLAWFFTKYFTDGRFKCRFLVLDDPAQTMDQPTFRDLCRFFETIIRLHTVHGKVISLVLMLHQDSRALDAARATNAVVHFLRWNKDTKVIEKRLLLRGERIVAPQPLAAISAT